MVKEKQSRDKVLVELFERGSSIREIAEKMGVSYMRVWQILRRLGALQNDAGQNYVPRPRPNDVRNQEIARLYVEKGNSLSEIAESYNLTRQRVSQLLRDAGVDGEAVRRGRAEQRKVERKKKELERAEKEKARLREIEKTAPLCVVCGKPNVKAVLSKGHRITCSSKCSKAWVIIRYLDEARNTSHREGQARTILRAPEKYKPSQREWAKRVVSKGIENVPRAKRPYTIPGSSVDLVTRQMGIPAPPRNRKPEPWLYMCGVPVKIGGRCHRPVKHRGDRCWYHDREPGEGR